jgi:hypothetical protein
VARRVVVGDLRVQQIDRKGGRRSWTNVWPEGTEHREADRFLCEHDGSGTQRTYAYVLVDHLRGWERECRTLDRVVLRDLERYMGRRHRETAGKPRCSLRPESTSRRSNGNSPHRHVSRLPPAFARAVNGRPVQVGPTHRLPRRPPVGTTSTASAPANWSRPARSLPDAAGAVASTKARSA